MSLAGFSGSVRLAKLEGAVYTVFFATFVRLVLAIAAAEMGQIMHFSSDDKSGIWFDF